MKDSHPKPRNPSFATRVLDAPRISACLLALFGLLRFSFLPELPATRPCPLRQTKSAAWNSAHAVLLQILITESAVPKPSFQLASLIEAIRSLNPFTAPWELARVKRRPATCDLRELTFKSRPKNLSNCKRAHLASGFCIQTLSAMPLGRPSTCHPIARHHASIGRAGVAEPRP